MLMACGAHMYVRMVKQNATFICRNSEFIVLHSDFTFLELLVKDCVLSFFEYLSKLHISHIYEGLFMDLVQ